MALIGPDGAFITGSDFLMDGGVTAAYWVRRTGTEIVDVLRRRANALVIRPWEGCY